MDAIIEIVVLALFSAPGAFVRWILFNRDKSYKEVLSYDGYTNGIIGVLIYATIIIIYTTLLR